MKLPTRFAFLALLLAVASFSASAQDYPSKPLHVIAPFPPGGPVDVLGRVLAQGLSDTMHIK